MITPRRLVIDLLEFCKENLGWDKCDHVVPYYRYKLQPSVCTFPTRLQTRNNRRISKRHVMRKHNCLRLGGNYTPSKVVLMEKGGRKRYIDSAKFDPICPICFEEYGKYRPAWACEECDHYMCAACYDTIMHDAILNGETSFACPLCRNTCTTPEPIIITEKISR